MMRQVVVILIIVTFAAVANAFEIGWDSYPWHVKYSGWRDNTGKVSNKCVVTLGNFQMVYTDNGLKFATGLPYKISEFQKVAKNMGLNKTKISRASVTDLTGRTDISNTYESSIGEMSDIDFQTLLVIWAGNGFIFPGMDPEAKLDAYKLAFELLNEIYLQKPRLVPALLKHFMYALYPEKAPKKIRDYAREQGISIAKASWVIFSRLPDK